MDRLDQLFALLDQWRHLPAYQFERRADILFAIYLPAFLTDHFKVPIRPEMIPEFPVRLGSIYPNTPVEKQNRSCKIDYVVLARDGSRVWFVELKTDALSRRERQDDYLLAAQRTGMPTLVDGVTKLFLSTNAKNKYYHLLKLLESADLLRSAPAIHHKSAVSWRGVAADIAASTINQKQREISVVYLQSRQTEPGEIGFEAFAGWLGQFGDPLSRKFSGSLRRWAASPAGMQV